jgi:hypothetical protein
MAKIMENTLDVRVDFKPESLPRIEKAINRIYPIGHEPIATTIISYGIYLGEVFVRNHPGASWGPYKEDIMELEFRIDYGERSFIGYPLKRVHKFWFDRSQALSAYYHINIDALEGRIQPELGDEWKDYYGEYQYRFPTSIRSSNQD